MLNNNEVFVVDSLMGSGKTSYAIQLMKEAEIEKSFIYVTPFLDEVQRIKQEVRNRDFKEPENRHGSGTKLQSLKRLIGSGEDIVTTHALFGMADEELLDLLRWGNYTLIIDEAMEVATILELKKDDLSVLVDSGLIEISDNNRVVWTGNPDSDTRYNEIRDYALAGNLYVSNNALVWNFPVKMFELFEQVYILTYLFDGQVQRYYFDLHGIKYEYYSVAQRNRKFTLEPKLKVTEDRFYFKDLIHIYEGKLNEIGDKKTALSKSWFENGHNSIKIKTLKDNLYNYFRNIQRAKAEEILWTTFVRDRNKIKGNGFSKEEPKYKANGNVRKVCFTAFNLRATNKYRHKTVLAFCLNRYMQPPLFHFFYSHNIKVDEDLLALSDLLQWVFRSAIRDGKSVELYVPSHRMRELLYKWLNNEL